MDQCPAGDPVLGMEEWRGARLAFDEVEPPCDGVVHRRHQPVRDRPFDPAPEVGPLAMQLQRDSLAAFQLLVEIAPHRRREPGILDPEHHLHVDEEATEIDVRRADIDHVVDDPELRMQLGRLVLVHLDAPPQEA